MEQDNEKATPSPITKDEVSFLNRPSTRFFIFILVVFGVYYGYSHNSKRNQCDALIAYVPGTQTYINANGVSMKGEEAHYTYGYSGTLKLSPGKFKNKDEAMSRCINDRDQ